jgi:NAD(P)-dependent dehydrogenase (short-subunit alcohol dehydrogenase family)
VSAAEPQAPGRAAGTLEGRFAVTGGGSGIGAGVAVALRRAGAEVVVLDRSGRRAADTAAAVGGTWRELDVTDPPAVTRAFDECGPLSGAVNCAGIGFSAPMVAQSLEDWRRVTAVNLDGTFLCMQAAARNMLRHGEGGSIVNIASINASFVHRGLSAYAASKAAVVALTRVAAAELAPAGIRVNGVAPGMVATGMTRRLLDDPEQVATWTASIPMRRVAEPADIADLVVFLCGDESRWLVGQTLLADGGASLSVEPPMSADSDYSPDALLAAAEAQAGSTGHAR